MACQVSSSLSTSDLRGHRTIQTFRCGGDWLDPSCLPHHQMPTRTLPHNATTRSSKGIPKATTDTYFGCTMKPGRSERKAALSYSQAFRPKNFKAWASRSSTVLSFCSAVTGPKLTAPSPLLKCVGFMKASTMVSPFAEASSHLRTRSSTKRWIALRTFLSPWTSNSTGICGTPKFLSILLSMILSPRAWIVCLPALSAFIASIKPARSNFRTAAMPSTSKSEFSSKALAAASHGCKAASLRGSRAAGAGSITGSNATNLPPVTSSGTCTVQRLPSSPRTESTPPGSTPSGT
mmetsp:Transcript_102640/g.290084  ORF Transcript_102640/g.290084 Transcript_102640/m.290084 type:complete len:292 (+) Transcript_102640:1117-1992(+)